VPNPLPFALLAKIVFYYFSLRYKLVFMPNLPVTVIIPVYNRAALCVEALQSVYSQTRMPAEVIVVDDGSTTSLKEVKFILNQHTGILLKQENQGVAAARNLGAKHATQPWLAFLDSDDLWQITKLEKQFKLHENQEDLLISQTKELWVKNGNQVRQKRHHACAVGNAFEQSLKSCCISASAVIIRKDIFVEEGGFDTSFSVCEDYDLWIRLTRKYPVGLVPEELVVKRRGFGDQLSDSVQVQDKLRVRSLLKLLSSDLTLDQQKLVKSEISRKLSILENGAHKRGLSNNVTEYQQIRSLLI
jgi:glycosyltransferase involved in cell wall biosynthesis